MSLTSRKVESHNPFILSSPLKERSSLFALSRCVPAIVEPFEEGALLLYLHGQNERVTGYRMLIGY
jgi:hypothetical protein